MWQYYDFDKNKDIFFKAWSTDAVQSLLEVRMHQLYGRNIWKKGEALWGFSDGYWRNQIALGVGDEILKYNMVNRFKRRVEDSLGRKPIKMTDNVIAQCSYRVSKSLLKDHLPKTGTIESLVLDSFEGSIVMSEALFETASLLFPDDDIISNIWNDDVIVLVRNKKIVFHLIDFYFSTRHAQNRLLKNEDYDSMLDFNDEDDEY